MQKFKETIRVGWPRADGEPGFREFKKGRTPESYGLTPGEVERVKSQLVEFDGVTATVDMTADEAIEQLTIEQKIAFAIAAMLKDDPKQKDRKLWTKAKEPRVEAIEKIIGENITEDQRDEGWANFQKEV